MKKNLIFITLLVSVVLAVGFVSAGWFTGEVTLEPGKSYRVKANVAGSSVSFNYKGSTYSGQIGDIVNVPGVGNVQIENARARNVRGDIASLRVVGNSGTGSFVQEPQECAPDEVWIEGIGCRGLLGTNPNEVNFQYTGIGGCPDGQVMVNGACEPIDIPEPFSLASMNACIGSGGEYICVTSGTTGNQYCNCFQSISGGNNNNPSLRLDQGVGWIQQRIFGDDGFAWYYVTWAEYAAACRAAGGFPDFGFAPNGDYLFTCAIAQENSNTGTL